MKTIYVSIIHDSQGVVREPETWEDRLDAIDDSRLFLLGEGEKSSELQVYYDSGAGAWYVGDEDIDHAFVMIYEITLNKEQAV